MEEYRYWREGLPTIPHVMFRHFQPSRHCRYASARIIRKSKHPISLFPSWFTPLTKVRPCKDRRHTRLANHQSIPECRNQLLQRKQIISPLNTNISHILRHCCHRVLRCSARTQRDRSSFKADQPCATHHTKPPDTLRSCRLRRCTERIPNAW